MPRPMQAAAERGTRADRPSPLPAPGSVARRAPPRHHRQSAAVRMSCGGGNISLADEVLDSTWSDGAYIWVRGCSIPERRAVTKVRRTGITRFPHDVKGSGSARAWGGHVAQSLGLPLAPSRILASPTKKDVGHAGRGLATSGSSSGRRGSEIIPSWSKNNIIWLRQEPNYPAYKNGENKHPALK